MGLIVHKLSVDKIKCDNYVRLDPKYRVFSDVKHFKVWGKCENIALKKVLFPLESPKIKKGELDNDYKLVELQNIERCGNTLFDVETVSKIGSDKVIIKNGDIVIPKMEPQKGQFFLNEQHQLFLGSSELIEYEINKDLYAPLFLYYLLVIPDVLKCMKSLESGKAHQRVNTDDLLKIKIPKVPLNIQNKIIKQIKPIEEGISKLKSSKTSHIDIINEVFGAEFGYTKEDCDRFGKGMTAGTQKFVKREPIHYRCCLSNMSNSTNLRNSSRFHNPNSQYFYEKLTARPTIKVFDVLKEIEKGVQPKYDSEGEIPVVKISNLKNSKIDLENPELISYEWYNSLPIEKSLQKDDVIFCCTGKCSLGKVDIVDFENEAVLSIDNYCLRLDKEKYNPLFFTFFFRSMLGVFQFERDFTGTTNQIHLYDEQIKCFDIPDLSLEKQQEIVSEIESRINAQKDIDKKIAEKRQKISALIENAIRENC